MILVIPVQYIFMSETRRGGKLGTSWECSLDFLDHGVYFGASLALDGDTLAVGEPGYPPSGGGLGAVLVFRRNITDPYRHWKEVVRLEDPAGNFVTFYYLGTSLDIEGDIIVAGGPGSSSATTPPPGVVIIFERNKGGTENWGCISRLTDPGGVSKDYFGSRVSINDQILAIGVRSDDDFGDNAGAIHIYEKEPAFLNYLPLISF